MRKNDTTLLQHPGSEHHERSGSSWAVGLLTKSDTAGTSLARTLESYRDSGIGPMTVFADLKGKGDVWNFARALSWLIATYPEAKAYLLLQDDLAFSQNIYSYLEQELWPGACSQGCVCSLFTPGIFEAPVRWHMEPSRHESWMMPAHLFHPVTAKQLANDLSQYAEKHGGWNKLATVLDQWMKEKRLDIWFHNPSLVQHVVKKPVDFQVQLSRNFIGEQSSAQEYFATPKKTKRARQKLPWLEVYSNSHCHRSCPRCDKKPVRTKYPHFQFTPEMAKRLADALDEYDCDVENLLFVGGEPLLWTYLEECVDLLRMTGKVKSIHMITSLLPGISMNHYEEIFDKIYVSDYGINRDLIEVHTENKSMYVVMDRRKHDYLPLGRIPGTIPSRGYCTEVSTTWLLGDQVYFCEIGCPMLFGNVDLAFSQEEIDSYSWSLDEFFSDVDVHRQNFGNRNICEACHVNPNVMQIVGSAPVLEPDLHGKAVYEIRHEAPGIRHQGEVCQNRYHNPKKD